jgi:ribosomal protein S12 methylthiotransferase accessory factor
VTDPLITWMRGLSGPGPHEIALRDVATGRAGQAEPATLAVWRTEHRLCLGPVTRPGIPGCDTCVRTRRRRVDPAAAQLVAWVWEDGWTETLGEVLVALARDLDQPPGRDHLLSAEIDLRTLVVAYQRSLPDPLCARCAGGGPPDCPSRAQLRLETPAPPPAERGWRLRPPASLLAGLRQTYVDANTGVITSTELLWDDGFVIATAVGAGESGSKVRGHGMTDTPDTAEACSLLEALERLGGICARGYRPTTVATIAEVADRGVDPRRYGTHDRDRMAQPGFPVPPIADDVPYRWVWGWSLVRDTAVLVPHSLAYYGLPPWTAAPDHPAVAREVSNGCAIGGSDAEACLAGLLEVVERDAFMLTWYRGLRLPELAHGSLPEHLRDHIASVAERLNVSVHLFDTTMEHGIPSVLVLTDSGPGTPLDPARLSCTAGAGLDAEEAITRALAEIGVMTVANRIRYRERLAEAAAMVADSELVLDVLDHPLPYGHSDGPARLGFLRFGTAVDLADSRIAQRPIVGAGASSALAEVVARLARVADDVIAVRQTSTEHELMNLSVVKTLVPQLLPITFGHRMCRTGNLPRLWTVPDALGIKCAYVDVLNPWPHPFA